MSRVCVANHAARGSRLLIVALSLLFSFIGFLSGPPTSDALRVRLSPDTLESNRTESNITQGWHLCFPARILDHPDIPMIEAETGCVLFACSGVEPREGQTLVVVGNSSELGGWDASRGAPLHRVKNPAFAGLWMCFPMLHSARSHVRFQFALVGPG
eukprot:Cvel_19500.t1-p1 / transcript=Cvel_19500.t1 / gene=Cvel_19500 / organism=Chromera_velia_CCMP2878 / gene_product=hypothetical protein / transcript_product=hypothetical protein / location=Cvel_scaffold1687:1-604(-) / protein_length=156 / sequence_SO=supercontig / SO=protein_coding / is_pseudo=false